MNPSHFVYKTPWARCHSIVTFIYCDFLQGSILQTIRILPKKERRYQGVLSVKGHVSNSCHRWQNFNLVAGMVLLKGSYSVMPSLAIQESLNEPHVWKELDYKVKWHIRLSRSGSNSIYRGPASLNILWKYFLAWMSNVKREAVVSK